MKWLIWVLKNYLNKGENMKKKVILISIVILLIGGVTLAFNLFKKSDLQEDSSNQQITSSENNNTGVVESSEDAMEGTRIKLTINENDVYVNLNNSKSSNDLLSLLPLALEFEDFNNTEKIAYLPRKITTLDAPDGYTPKLGDFAYYAPWGNIAIFYKEFRYSESLIKLGKIESGIENLENISDGTLVTIERVD